jgi:hypothetical protein
VRNRSADMVEALYTMNKVLMGFNYLNPLCNLSLFLFFFVVLLIYVSVIFLSSFVFNAYHI